MKKKGMKKIHLSRETLRHLDNETLVGVVGAATENPTRCDPNSGCPSCETCGLRCNSDTCRPCVP